MQDAKILKNLYVFRGLNQLQLAQFNKVLRVRPVKVGERVVQEGDTPDAMYVIQSGQFQVLKGNDGHERTLATLGPGQHFGEIGLIDHQPRSASVEAASDGEICVLTKQDTERILNQYPELRLRVYENFLEALCERLRSANENLLIADSSGNG